MNNKFFKKKEGSRYSQFIELEKPFLGKLPDKRYEQTYFKQVRIHMDYHFELDNHYYSVPYYLSGELVECRYTQATVEILHHNKRIASHARSYLKNKVTTLTEHMPPAHKAHHDWKPTTFLAWAKTVGSGAENAASAISHNKKHQDQIYRLYLGFKQLAKNYGNDRLNKACLRAIAVNSICYQSISSILKTNLDQQEFIEEVKSKEITNHENVRGSNYYKKLINEGEI